MIVVYQEMKNPSYAEIVAVFADEEIYEVCFPIIEKQAKKHHFQFITESVEEYDIDSLVGKFYKNQETWMKELPKIKEILPEEEE